MLALVQPPRQPPLAGLDSMADDRGHPKSFAADTGRGFTTLMKHRELPKDFEFFTRSAKNWHSPRLV
jgi:hypothetical protein